MKKNCVLKVIEINKPAIKKANEQIKKLNEYLNKNWFSIIKNKP